MQKVRGYSYISDIARQDIEDHGDDPPPLIKKVRNWLASNSPGTDIPGNDTIRERFNEFSTDVGIRVKLQFSEADLGHFHDFRN